MGSKDKISDPGESAMRGKAGGASKISGRGGDLRTDYEQPHSKKPYKEKVFDCKKLERQGLGVSNRRGR